MSEEGEDCPNKKARLDAGGAEPVASSHATQPSPHPSPGEAYYLANFKFILNYVLRESPDGHVIVPSEVATVGQFLMLPG